MAEGIKMVNIVDRRKDSKGKSLSNRKKFLERNRRKLKRYIDRVAKKKNIKDLLKDDKTDVTIDTTKEPSFQYDWNTGDKDIILPGNDKYNKGDKLDKPEDGKGKAGKSASKDGDGEDEFSFTLSKEEFLDIYFSDMELPNFIKEGIKESLKTKKERAGYSKEGIPARLNIKKTFEQATARKIATKSQLKQQLQTLLSLVTKGKATKKQEEELRRLANKKARYLDDNDLRYNYFKDKHKPIKHAVMFCLMDVSASMGETEKEISKKFFLLLYLFLHKEYDAVDIRFLRHTHVAEEVNEDEFFYGNKSGGTSVASVLSLFKEIVDEEIDLTTTNIYVAQASDGDVFAGDARDTVDMMERDILQLCQYYAYIQVDIYERGGFNSLFSLYELFESRKNFSRELVTQDSEIYPVLHKLFKKGES